MSSKWKGSKDVERPLRERPRQDRRDGQDRRDRTDRRDGRGTVTTRIQNTFPARRPRSPSPSPPVVKSSPTSYAGISGLHDDKRANPGYVSGVQPTPTPINTHQGRDYRFGNEFVHGRYHFDRWLRAYEVPLRELYHEMITLIDQTTYLSKVITPVQYDEFVYFVYSNSTGYISPDA